MRQVTLETTRYMWRNEKNRLFMGILTILVFFYTLFVVPNISGENEINISNLERDMQGNVVQFEQALKDGLIVPNALTGTTAYTGMRRSYVAQREVLTALKQGDVRRYISIPYRPNAEIAELSGLEQLAYDFLGYEMEQPFQAQKNHYYATEVEDLSFHIVHDRTSIQQLNLFLLGFGPILLLLGLIFMISDVHVKDRSLETQKVGHPLSWQKYTWVQAMSALGFVAAFYVALGLGFYLLNGILHGFGSFQFPTGFYEANFKIGVYNSENFQLETISWFMLRIAPYLALLGYFFARLNTLLSLWTKQAVVTMALGMFTVLFQFIYYGSEATELLGLHIKQFPQTYFNIGKVLTGRFELQIGEAIPDLFSQGLLVLGITIVIIELLIYISSKKITRQKFFN